MRDRYATGSSVPPHCLVPPEFQPEYSDLPDCPIGELDDVGRRICEGNVDADRGDTVAVIHAESDRSYTFAELAELSNRLAGGLRSIGIGLGDRIAFRSVSIPELVVVALACWKAGAVIVPTPAQLRAHELKFVLEDTGARLLFVANRPELFEAVSAAIEGTDVEHVFGFGGEAEVAGYRSWSNLMADTPTSGTLPTPPSDSVAIIWHTGGTTGQPKPCYHTHRRLLLASHALADATGAGPGNRWSAAAPIGHALGFASHTFWPLLQGATVVMVEDFRSPRSLLRAIERHRIDSLTAISLTWAKMLDVLQGETFDASSLKRAYAMWQSASSSEVYEAWLARGVKLMNNFGCTAFASWILVPRQPDNAPRGSLGRAVKGYEVVALDLESKGVRAVGPGCEGRLAARGVSGLTYWNRPELQRRDVRDGWVLIDDVVSFDTDGNARYLGRTDFLISTAGHKVAPVEVEEVLSGHGKVREVGVVGAPDPIRQEVVTAFVAVNDDIEATLELKRELQDYVKAHLSPYKYPRRVEFVESLPRDHVGKLQPRMLREWAQNLSEVRA